MTRFAFFRPRQVWMPTIFGWLFLLVIGLVMTVIAVRNIYSFLAQNEPVGARVLVVEGWLAPEELDQAVQFFNKGGARIVTTGGPIQGWPGVISDTDHASLAAEYLAQHGVQREVITAVPAPQSAQERTFLSAVMFRESAQKLGIKLDAIDVFSAGPHARRTRLLYQMALGQRSKVGILAARPAGYDSGTWWQSSLGVESVVFQSVGFVWVKCFFWPGPPGSQKELWAAYRSVQMPGSNDS